MSRDPRIAINGLVNGREEELETPPIYRFEQYDRLYYAYNKKIVYPFPIDQCERGFLSEFHTIIHTNALEKLHNANLVQCPPGNDRLQVLDVGCGTGDWCEIMAQEHDDMDFYGIDLFLNHPIHNPIPGTPTGNAANDPHIPNCMLYMPVDFTQYYWPPFQEGSFDFIRAARLCGSVPDWRHLYSCISRYLKPGGFVERIELDFEPHAIEGYAFPPEARPLFTWWNLMKTASRRNGTPMEYQQSEFHRLLEIMGSSNFTHQTIKISLLRYPDRAWEKIVLESFLCMLIGSGTNAVTDPIYGLSVSLLTRQLSPGHCLSKEEVLRLCGDVVRVLQEGLNRDIPVYYNLHILTAKKPMR